MAEREQGFDLSSVRTRLPEYNALFDPNMRHFFENRNIQRHLHKTGQVAFKSWVDSIGFRVCCGCCSRLFRGVLFSGLSNPCAPLVVAQIDKNGRVIDLERAKAKLSIIEQEFKNAERTEHLRLKEEEDMRVSRHVNTSTRVD